MRKNFALEPRAEWFELADERIGCWRQPRITPGKGRRILVDLRVAILFSECIGDLSRVGVRVQRPVNGNPAREDIN
jgi:hypothetical protein